MNNPVTPPAHDNTGLSTLTIVVLFIVTLAIGTLVFYSVDGGTGRPPDRSVTCEDIGNGDCRIPCPFRAAGDETGNYLIIHCDD